jgi:hypothetical protein
MTIDRDAEFTIKKRFKSYQLTTERRLDRRGTRPLTPGGRARHERGIEKMRRQLFRRY